MGNGERRAFAGRTARNAKRMGMKIFMIKSAEGLAEDRARIFTDYH